MLTSRYPYLLHDKQSVCNLVIIHILLLYLPAQWIEISSKLAAKWRDMYKDWLNTARRVLVIPYEKLCEKTFEELEKIVTFLHQPIKVDQLQCAVSLYPCQCRDRTEFQPYYPEELPGYISEINNTLIKQFSTSLPSYGTKCPVI